MYIYMIWIKCIVGQLKYMMTLSYFWAESTYPLLSILYYDIVHWHYELGLIYIAKAAFRSLALEIALRLAHRASSFSDFCCIREITRSVNFNRFKPWLFNVNPLLYFYYIFHLPASSPSLLTQTLSLLLLLSLRILDHNNIIIYQHYIIKNLFKYYLDIRCVSISKLFWLVGNSSHCQLFIFFFLWIWSIKCLFRNIK